MSLGGIKAAFFILQSQTQINKRHCEHPECFRDARQSVEFSAKPNCGDAKFCVFTTDNHKTQ